MEFNCRRCDNLWPYRQVERGAALPGAPSPQELLGAVPEGGAKLSETDHADYEWIFPHQRALAKFGNVPKEGSELAFEAGELVIVLGEGKGEWEEWVWGRNDKGEVGTLPENLIEYLHIVDALELEEEVAVI